MASKDQAIGAIILFVCIAITVAYVVSLSIFEDLRFWLIAIPVVIAFLAIMFIGAWIGWTMATTSPPKPIEELKTGEEEKEDTEEKKKQ